MKHARAFAARARAGLTMIELLFALIILSVLMVLVFQLIDRTLSVWRKSETRRSVLEQAASVADLFAHDLGGLENGRRGDIVLEWVRFDTDNDGVAESSWPRIRLVREASSADVARLSEEAARDNAPAPAPKTAEAKPGAAKNSDASSTDDDQRTLQASPGLVEAVWLIAPASLTDKDARAEGILWRGERLVDDKDSKSFFAPDFFGSSGRPPAGATEEVTAGVLWMQVLCAAQTSVVHGGWNIGKELGDAATSWDAWNKNRPDVALHPWNERHAGMPVVKERPCLPRRVRVEFEFERPADRLRRTRLVENIDLADARIVVDDGARLPEPKSFVRIDAEWMQLVSVDGNSAVVKRAARGTAPLSHAKESMVHFGAPLAREVIITTCREDWNL